MAAINTVRLDWLRENHFQLWDREGFPILMAPAPDGANGADLLPLSLVGCYAWDIMSLLKERGMPVTGLSASAVSQQDDEPPWQFRRITIQYRFYGQGLEIEAIQQAVRDSQSKYCSIYSTLRDAVDITTEVEILGGEPEN